MKNSCEFHHAAKSEMNNGVTIVTDLRNEVVSVYYPITPPAEVTKWLTSHGFTYRSETRGWNSAGDLTTAHLLAHECAGRFPAETPKIRPGAHAAPAAP